MPIEPNGNIRATLTWSGAFSDLKTKTLEKMNLATESIEVADSEIEITLRKPDTHNWGYDIVIFGSSAIEPSVLETLRPDELVEFTLPSHNSPGNPIQVIYGTLSMAMPITRL